MRPTRSPGFTLIEIMVVIVVIAILLALLLPNLVRSKYQGHLSACEHNQRAMASAMENYAAQYTRYPTALTPLFSGGFVQPVVCPSDRSSYGYAVDTSGQSYTTVCRGTHHVGLPEAVSPGFPQYAASSGLARHAASD